MRAPTILKTRAADVQESLKILQFRFGLDVAFRPVVVRRGVRYYSVECKLRGESDSLRWTRVH